MYRPANRCLARKSPELAERALRYFTNDLVREQDNREAVARQAVQAISVLPAPKSEKPIIDDDWLHQFRRLAASKSNADLQAIVGRILAGEVHQPGSFAPFTLEVIARLDQQTARVFETVASHALIIPDHWDMVVTTILAEDGVHHETLLNYGSALMHLASCGLVTSPGVQQIYPEAFSRLPRSTLGGRPIVFEKCDPTIPVKTWAITKGEVVHLTQAGGQLQSIISKTFDPAYAQRLKTGLARVGVSISFPGIIPEETDP